MWRLLFTKNDPSHVFARYLGPVIIYRLGRAEDFGDTTWFLGEQRGGSVVTENPKGGITENFGRIQRGTTQICLQNEDIGEGGGGGESRKSSNVIRGITSVR